jgi:hypothetical protein
VTKADEFQIHYNILYLVVLRNEISLGLLHFRILRQRQRFTDLHLPKKHIITMKDKKRLFITLVL